MPKTRGDVFTRELDPDECCNVLARYLGYMPVHGRPGYWASSKVLMQGHPVPETINAIALAMPPGWMLDSIQFGTWNKKAVTARAHRGFAKVKAVVVSCYPGGPHGPERRLRAEVLARARLAIAAWHHDTGWCPSPKGDDE